VGKIDQEVKKRGVNEGRGYAGFSSPREEKKASPVMNIGTPGGGSSSE